MVETLDDPDTTLETVDSKKSEQLLVVDVDSLFVLTFQTYLLPSPSFLDPSINFVTVRFHRLQRENNFYKLLEILEVKRRESLKRVV